jgi:hypothetical protein
VNAPRDRELLVGIPEPGVGRVTVGTGLSRGSGEHWVEKEKLAQTLFRSELDGQGGDRRFQWGIGSLTTGEKQSRESDNEEE